MLQAWHIWVILGILLWIIEIFTPAFVAGVLGTACLIVAPFAAGGLPLTNQLLVLGLATAVLALKIRPLALRYLHRHGAKARTNVEAMVGKPGVIVAALDHPAGATRVKIGGEEWLAVTQDGAPIPVGTKVIIRQVEGCKVVVERDENP